MSFEFCFDWVFLFYIVYLFILKFVDEFIVNVVYIGILGKGIFVVDEFIWIIRKCFVSINVENVELNRCVLCEFLFIILGVF